MRLSSIATGALALAGSAFAAPAGNADIAARQAITDVTILQFALTLEHLENVFYKQALKKFSQADFIAAGYSVDYYNNLKYVAFDEETHVIALTAAIKGLGAKPVAACTYNFPYTDVPSFIQLSQVLESTGVSAYTGAAALIQSSYYLTVAATILDVEALHTSYQRTALGEVPFASPFETPLDANSVFTLASMFIVKCPPSNPPLPFVAFPYLTTNGKVCTCEEPQCGDPSLYVKRSDAHYPAPYAPDAYTPSCSPPSAGDTVSFTAAGRIPAGSFLTFVNGLVVTSIPASISGTVATGKVPATIVGGQTYVFITNKDLEGDFTAFSDAAVLFGPAVLEVNPAPPVIHYNILK